MSRCCFAFVYFEIAINLSPTIVAYGYALRGTTRRARKLTRLPYVEKGTRVFVVVLHTIIDGTIVVEIRLYFDKRNPKSHKNGMFSIRNI